MQKNFSPLQGKFAGGPMIWAVPAVILLVSLLALPAYIDAMNLQIFDNEFFSSLCGFVGWGGSAN